MDEARDRAEPTSPAAEPAGVSSPLSVDRAALAVGGRSRAEQQKLLIALQRSAGNVAARRLLESMAPPRLGRDEREPAGAVRLAQFLDGLHAAATVTVTDALAGTPFESRGCPWLDHWIDYYRVRPAAQVEEAVRRYAPATRSAPREEWIPLICARIRTGIEAWQRTGEIPPPPADGPGPPPGEPAPAERTAARARAQLGPGRPLEPAVRSRMGGALGADLSHVRVHTGARAPQLTGARALTVGEHVAFAPGAYEPGTPVGDALLSHELMHVLQQDGAGAPAGAAESDADRGAGEALGALYAGGPPARRPALRSGLALQRCPAGPTERKDIKAADVNVMIVPKGPRAVITLTGTRGQFSVQQTNLPADRQNPMADWHVIKPDGRRVDYGLLTTNNAPMNVLYDQAGRWRIVAMVRLGQGQTVMAAKEVEVRTVGAVSEEAWAQVDVPGAHGYERYRAALELRAIEAGGAATLQQRAGSDFITLDAGSNPVFPVMPLRHTYSVRANPQAPPGAQKPASYRWYAVPEQDDYFQPGYGGHPVTTYHGKQAFALGTGTSAGFFIQRPNAYTIVCEQLDTSGTILKTVSYRQVVMTHEQALAVGRVREAITLAKDQMEQIKEGTEQRLRALYTSDELGYSSELMVFAGPAADGSGHRVIDVTPGVKRSVYKGRDLETAIADFGAANEHPPGIVLIEGQGLARRQLKARGKSTIKRDAQSWGLASIGAAVAGVVSLFTPAAFLAPYLFAGAGVAGTVAGSLSIEDQLRNNEPDAVMIAIDAAGIAASLFGLGEASGMIAGGKAVTLSRGMQFMRYGGFTSGAIMGVLITYKASAEISAILSDPKLKRDEKIARIVQVLAAVALVGGLLVYGGRNLRTSHTRLDKELGRSVVRSLQADEIQSLGMLDDVVLRAMNGLERREIENIARVVASNPAAARVLSLNFKDDFVLLARSGRFSSLDELAEEIGRRLGKQRTAVPGAHETAKPPEGAVRSGQGQLDELGRPADAIALEQRLAKNAHGEVHEYHMTEDGRLWRCSDVCVEVVGNVDDRVRGVRDRSIQLQSTVQWEKNWRLEAMEISKSARRLRDRLAKIREDHARRLRTIEKAKKPGRREQLEESRRTWLEEARENVRIHADSIERRMSELERIAGVQRAAAAAPAAQAPSLPGLRGRYDDILGADQQLADEAASIERASRTPTNAVDVQRRLAELERRLIAADEARIPTMIAEARLAQAETGVGTRRFRGYGDKCVAQAGGAGALSGADIIAPFEQRTLEVLRHGRAIGHAFAPLPEWDVQVGGVLNARLRAQQQAQEPVVGAFYASHAEKQAAIARPNRPIGVSLPMCPDCRAYFRRVAGSSGRVQVVADPDMVRVFHPDGRITSPHYQAPPQ